MSASGKQMAAPGDAELFVGVPAPPVAPVGGERPLPLDHRVSAREEVLGITPPSRRGGSRPLADAISHLGFLPADRMRAAVEEAMASGRRLDQVLIETGMLTQDQLARATAERFGLDHIDLGVYQLDLAAVNLLSAQAARRYNAVPVGFDENEALLLATADPGNVHALDDIRLLTRSELRPVVASAEDIAGVIGRMSHLDTAVAEAVEEESDDPDEAGEIRESAGDAPVIKLVNSIIAQAVADGASDIHFEPGDRDMRVRFRIDGVLSSTTTIPRRMVAGVVSRVKIMGDLDIAERRLPQDGRISLSVGGHSLDLRIVTLPSVHGEGIVMRLLDKNQVLLTLDTLGMSEGDHARFEGAFQQAHGAVLVTGPTGSGKSTTLYAALNSLNSIEKNILTIEDPVEYQLPGINQIQINRKAGLDFPQGLRSMLRADPDVIMVGEIRDSDTARIAIESALTGHLVLSTLHTNDAPAAITRLTEMGIAPFLTASAVDCVVAQRLARTLCSDCKRPVVLKAEALKAANFPADSDFEAFDPVGCGRCKYTGYRGRTGIYEVMTLSDEIRSMAIERAAADAIRAKAIEEGMRPLREDGLDKVRQGRTSIAEVSRVT